MSDKIFKKVFFIFFPIVAIFLGGGFSFVVISLNDLKGIQILEEYRPAAKTRVFDSKGKVIAEFFREKRKLINYDSISPYLISATLSIEDKRFSSHYGIDLWRIAKALLVNLFAMRKKEGGSTITIQLSKVLFLDYQKTFKRKFRELWYTVQIEKQYSKKEILFLYLNQLNYGHGYYGVEASSEFYFKKPAKEITLAQAALLASIPKSPVYYSPLRYPKNVKKRHRFVLQTMVNNGYVSQKNARDSFKQYWVLFYKKKNSKDKKIKKNVKENVAAHFVEYIRQKLERDIKEKDIYKHGLNVYTSLDVDMQRIAEEEIKKVIEWQNLIKNREKKILAQQNNLIYLDRISHFARIFSMPSFDLRKPVERRFAYDLFLKKYHQSIKSLGLLSGSIKLWDFFHLDFLNRERHQAIEKGVETAMIVIDPSSGYVKVMVGGSSFDYHNQFNRSVLLRRQIGSLLKPFIYAIAFEKRIMTPSTLLQDIPMAFDKYIPKNYNGKYRGPVLVRQALSKSINVLAVETLSQIGIDVARENLSKIFHVVREKDKNRLFPKDLTMALGTGGFSPLDMAVAYAVLANEGREVVPKTIRYVTDANGQIIKDYEKKYAQAPVRRLISEETAFLIANIIRDVFRVGGTAFLPELLKEFSHKNYSFGKTGTTSNWTDAWFAGANKHLSAAIWFGYDDNRSLGKGRTGGRVAAPVWINFQKRALFAERPLPFRKPVGVVTQKVCRQLGQLAGPYDKKKDVYVEYFHYDNIPEGVCNYNVKKYKEEEKLIQFLDASKNRKKEVLKVLELINNFQDLKD